MSKNWTLTQESFDRLLYWLDPDREQAGKKYENIRQSLIKIFTWRGVNEAEDLADETINRVARKVHELAKTYSGDPVLYFHGVAKNVLMQYQHRRISKVPIAILPQEVPELNELEGAHQCLERCLERLTPSNRELILLYYQREKQAKIDQRRRLAERFKVATNALRVRAYRIRETLERCVRDCLKDDLP